MAILLPLSFLSFFLPSSEYFSVKDDDCYLHHRLLLSIRLYIVLNINT